MKLEELKRHEVHVDVRPVDGADGELRVVTVLSQKRVLIQYITVHEYLKGHWEPGLVYKGDFGDWESLVSSLEQFLGRPISEWRNFSKEPFAIHDVDSGDPAANLDFFIRKVHGRQLQVPDGVPFTLTSIYWQQIEKHGCWDETRAIREQEESLSRD